jgi:AraC-like DNA-binding protein
VNSVLAAFSLFVAGQSFFLVVIVLALSPVARISNRLLAAFILVKFCKFMLFYFGFGAVDVPRYLFLLQNLSFAAGPLLYLYVLSLVTESFSWQRRYLWHFLPALLATLLSPIIYDIAVPSVSAGFLIDASDPQNLPRSMHIAVGALWFLAYLLLARRLLPGYENRLREQYSSIEALTLVWLRRIINVALLAYALITMLDIAGLLLSLDNEPRRLVELCAYTLLFYVIAINGLRRGLLLEADKPAPVPSGESGPIPEAVPETGAARPKYQRSMLDGETSSQIVQLADQVMSEQKPFLASDFKLPQLAALIGVSSHDLSQAINSGGQTYYDYVNGYRANKARELIAGGQCGHLAMLDLALEVGFNSKSTFYKHFRRQFKQTPAEFKKSTVL